MQSTTRSMPAPRSPLGWILLGGLAIAVLDALFASTYWQVSMARVFRSIAAGFVGVDAARAGGTGMAVLGGATHLFIATMFVAIYAWVGRRFGALLRQPFVFGPLYGLAVYALMNHVVVPLSRIGPQASPAPVPWTVASIVFHVVVVGLVSAWCARRAHGARLAEI